MISRKLIASSEGYGHVTIPSEYMKELKWENGTPLRIEKIENAIIVTPVNANSH
ncbi:AbrB/MazE/SpoVT family DNA-binding domain-containing protein [uncultured Methanomethylovorans sp.]|uniref:AbrB/MazE/SpoVT family DNA-binding domain-containing protein n=1 Tax=uncultured Methanomethylovorans sp. TaxID=183759 RepID=UPI002AA87EE3|nr:AbrB/MazE/SpoVT family DNA-binding domain-containing protein [uncultured Methanomethylovorans sp.]